MLTKKELFLAAMNNGNYKSLAWVINAFSISIPDPNEAMPFSIFRTNGKISYSNKDKDFEELEVRDPTKPVYSATEPVTINAGDLINVTETLNTTYGRILANCILTIYPFDGKVPFMNEHNFLGKLTKTIVGKLKPTPKNESEKTKDFFYIDEFLKLTEGADYLTGFSKLFIIANTPKTISPPPGIDEFKKKLFKEYEGKMHDPLIAAIIDKKIADFGKAYLKDDPGMNFFISGKQTDIVYKKMFLSLGAEPGLGGDPTKVDYIENSLQDGWDITKLPSMNNAMRKGSYSRGANTQLGGVRVKWLLRSTSGLIITMDDCGTRLGLQLNISERNVNRLVGFHITTGKQSWIKIDSKEQANAYIGSSVMVRSPQYCKAPGTEFCKYCVGEKLSINPNGLGSAAGEIGSRLMLISMSSAHSKGLTTTNLDLSKAFI